MIGSFVLATALFGQVPQVPYYFANQLHTRTAPAVTLVLQNTGREKSRFYVKAEWPDGYKINVPIINNIVPRAGRQKTTSGRTIKVILNYGHKTSFGDRDRKDTLKYGFPAKPKPEPEPAKERELEKLDSVPTPKADVDDEIQRLRREIEELRGEIHKARVPDIKPNVKPVTRSEDIQPIARPIIVPVVKSEESDLRRPSEVKTPAASWVKEFPSYDADN